MCGISGLFNKNGDKVDGRILELMTDTMIHRGPDDSGLFINGCVGLGHRRLSILDLNREASQPMKSHDGRFVVVFNGEIYNYLEIRQHLKECGCRFCTKSDTEVLIESYRRWGINCVKRFNGMWSFCIYDIEKERLFLSRDRLGVKPLYFLEREDVFAFASEIKSIIELFPEERQVDMVTMARFLRGVQEDSDAHTFYKNIKQLESGSNILVNLRDGSIKQWRYWSINIKEFRKKWKTNNPYRLCRILLEDAIRIRLRADVPVGASLSGGLDSSSIVEIASKKFKRKLKTFSSIYNIDGYDEEEFIRCVNNDIRNDRYYVYPDQGDAIIDDIREMVKIHDGPIHCASPYSGYCVYRGVGNRVKVLLDGQGADELFAGYPYLLNSLFEEFSVEHIMGFWKSIKMIAESDTIWSDNDFISPKKRIELMGVYPYIKTTVSRNRSGGWISWKELLNSKILNIDLEMSEDNASHNLKGLQKNLYNEQFHGTLPRILHDVDRNSMGFSLEVRLPFLDYRLVEFSYSIKSDLKYRNGWTKYILRRAMKPYLPKKIWSRRQKMGFPAPFSKWMHQPQYKDTVFQYIEAFCDRGLVKKDYVIDLYRKQLTGKVSFPDLFFRLMTAEMWLRDMIDLEGKKWHLHEEYEK